jgi:RNA polymerase sigma-70 factor (ECF subfamily)
MKVPGPTAHSIELGNMPTTIHRAPAESPPPELTVVRGGELVFRETYERWFGDVVRWVYALGIPDSEAEDLTQEVFLVVRRQLRSFRGGSVGAWLYRIAELTVRDHRRRAWFKNLFGRRRELDLMQVPNPAPSPERRYEEAETRRQFQQLVAHMSTKLRATFVLFEIEGYTGEEIAQIQDIPLGTVWTRLHHARKEFWRLANEQLRREEIRG